MQSNLYIVVIGRKIGVYPTCVSMFSARNCKSLPELVLLTYDRACPRPDTTGKAPSRVVIVMETEAEMISVLDVSLIVARLCFCVSLFALGRCRHENNC